MADDLRFKEAPAITGGRELYGKQGIEYAAVPSSNNAFQARYAIRHPWRGAVACPNPRRGVWGGNPNGYTAPIAASKVAFAPRGKLDLGAVIQRDLWEIGFKKSGAKPPPPPPPPGGFAKPPSGKAGFGLGVLLGAAGIAIGSWIARRRRG
jgi:hypothetical protein